MAWPNSGEAARLLCAVVLLGCGLLSVGPAHGQTSTQSPAAVVDSKARIISIGGDVTEIIYALGVNERLVAVDSTSQFPASALKSLKSVGYMRALSTEGVLSMKPTFIIASERAGPPEVVKALKSAITYVEIIDGTSAAGVSAKIDAVAAALGVTERGKVLSQQVRDDLTKLANSRTTINKPLRALFILNTQSGRVTVGGSGTSADAILSLAGLVNTASSVTGFKPVSDEALLTMRPEVAVVMARSSGEHDAKAALALPALATSPAAQNGKVIVMDGLMLLGFGPRVAEAARSLMREAYGDKLSGGGVD
jgi:iron complex transport system substrate-binding protein